MKREGVVGEIFCITGMGHSYGAILLMVIKHLKVFSWSLIKNIAPHNASSTDFPQKYLFHGKMRAASFSEANRRPIPFPI